MLAAFAALLVGAVALVGYLNGQLDWPERALYGAAAVANILFPTFSAGWTASLLAAALPCAWNVLIKPRLAPVAATANSLETR